MWGRVTGWLNDRDRAQPPSLATLWIGGTLLLWGLYTAVFSALGWPPGRTPAAMAFTNVAPLALLAAIVRAVLKTYVMPFGTVAQSLTHVVLAGLFATLWYGSIIMLQTLRDGLVGQSMVLTGFSRPALTWQVFQGLILYAMIAALCYAVRGGREAATVSFVESAQPLDRYLVRAGDEFRPVLVSDIASIVGAQDYSEVTTRDARSHLVRMSLGEFEQRLNTARFVRVHRSTIINLDHLDRVEPAGNGRMTAHLASGESVDVSRTGVQALRSFVV